jgi:hypothetical protein
MWIRYKFQNDLSKKKRCLLHSHHIYCALFYIQCKHNFSLKKNKTKKINILYIYMIISVYSRLLSVSMVLYIHLYILSLFCF